MILSWALILLFAFPLVLSKNKKQPTDGADEFFHQRPDTHKSSPGWQEPGLWRPKWIVEREFFAAND